MILELLIAIGTCLPIIGTVIVWNVRQEGRITNTNTRVDDLKEFIGEKFKDMDTGLDRRLSRIEKALNGHLKE